MMFMYAIQTCGHYRGKELCLPIFKFILSTIGKTYYHIVPTNERIIIMQKECYFMEYIKSYH